MDELQKDDVAGATFSEDRNYRYALWRIWDKSKPLVMFIGLNPSTANETDNDPTIKSVCRISKKNGYGGVYMMNLFAIISSDPKILIGCDNPIGNNNYWLMNISEKCSDIVFAWGSFKEAAERAKEIISNFTKFHQPKCIAQNKDGSPKHPLYCKSDSTFIPFVYPNMHSLLETGG